MCSLGLQKKSVESSPTSTWKWHGGFEVEGPCAGKLPFESAPKDDDGLLDLHLALYNNIIVFDHATKLAYCVTWVHMDAHAGVPEAYLAGKRALAAMTDRIVPCRTPNLPLGKARHCFKHHCINCLNILHRVVRRACLIYP